MDKSDEAAHGYGSNNLSDDAYGDMIMEERPDQYNIGNAYYKKYICAEVIIGVPLEGPRRATARRCVEDFDGEKLGKYYRNPLIDTWEYELEYDDDNHDRCFSNVFDKKLYSQLD